MQAETCFVHGPAADKLKPLYVQESARLACQLLKLTLTRQRRDSQLSLVIPAAAALVKLSLKHGFFGELASDPNLVIVWGKEVSGWCSSVGWARNAVITSSDCFPCLFITLPQKRKRGNKTYKACRIFKAQAVGTSKRTTFVVVCYRSCAAHLKIIVC
jgi:hypothetical protein